MYSDLSNLFVNPNGLLCQNCSFPKNSFWSKLLFDFTKIDVYPRFDGYDVSGFLINENDLIYIPDDKYIIPKIDKEYKNYFNI